MITNYPPPLCEIKSKFVFVTRLKAHESMRESDFEPRAMKIPLIDPAMMREHGTVGAMKLQWTARRACTSIMTLQAAIDA